jgi:hypothetical protein
VPAIMDVLLFPDSLSSAKQNDYGLFTGIKDYFYEVKI